MAVHASHAVASRRTASRHRPRRHPIHPSGLDYLWSVVGGLFGGVFVGTLIGLVFRTSEQRSTKLITSLIGLALSGVAIVFLGGLPSASAARACYAAGLVIGLYVGLADVFHLEPAVRGLKRAQAARRRS